MKKSSLQLMLVLIILVMLFTAMLSTGYAGSVLDYGQLPGIPAQANYVAWMGNAGTPPSQVMTEDSYNTASGVNQGYKDGYWWLAASNFNNPSATAGQTLNFVFGGRGLATGTIWTYTSPPYDISNAYTNHGTVGTELAGNCPSMLPGSQDGTGKTVNWSGANTPHLIYRSLLPSGTTNNASDGRYNYVTSVPAGTFTYLDTACATGNACWHIVVPANGSGAITGCHSEESSPTAIQLIRFQASQGNGTSLYLLFAISVMALMVPGVALVRRRVVNR